MDKEKEKKFHSWEEEKKDLLRQLSASRDEIRHYKCENIELMNAVKYYMEALSAEGEERVSCKLDEALVRENELKVQLDKSRAKNKALKARMGLLRHQVNNGRNVEDGLKGRLDSIRKKYEDLEEVNRCDVIEERTRADELKKQSDEINVMMETLAKIVSNLFDDLIKERNLEDELIKQLKESKVKNEALKKFNSDLHQMVIVACATRDELKEELEGLRVKNEALEEIMSDLRSDVIKETTRANELDELLVEGDMQRNEIIKTLSARLERSEHFLNEAMASTAALHEQVIQLVSRFQSAKATAETAIDGFDTLLEETRVMEEEKNQALDKLSIASIKIEDQEHQIAKLSETVEELEIEKNELDARLTITRGEFEDFQTLSTEHEASEAELEDEDSEPSAKLQVTYDSAEVLEKLLQEYHII